MKTLFLILALFNITTAVTGQKGLAGFGKITIAELEQKDCPFDPGADAYKLIDFGNLYYNRTADATVPFIAMFERRVRIKILKASAIGFANITIPFNSNQNEEKIIKVEACTFNLTDDHRIKKSTLGKAATYSRKVNKQYSEMILIFPEVKVGSVIEYKYLVQQKSITNIRDWYFQSNLPTRHSEYQVAIPSLFRYAIHPLTVDSLEQKETTYNDASIVKGTSASDVVVQKNFAMRNLPAIQNEPFMGSAKDYLQRLSFSIAEIDFGNGNVINVHSEWEEIVSELMGDADFGLQINKKLPAAAAIIDAAKKMTGLKNKVTFIYNYIRQNLQWNGEKSIYAFDGIQKTFINKSGSSGDLNLLLISLFKQAGIDALPVLFSTRTNGLVNTSLPFLNQFNTVMALVEDSTGQYVLDATNKFSAINLMSAEILNTKGFIVEMKEGRWLNIADTTHPFKVSTAVSATVDENGLMKGDALITSSNYARSKAYEELLESQGNFKTSYFYNENNLVKTDGITNENMEHDELPLEQKIKFSVAVNKTGAHYYFTTNLFSGLAKNPFLASERRTDIDFGYLQEYSIFGNYIVPTDFDIEELPQNISLVMPDTSIIFKRFIFADANAINVRINISFKRSWYAAAEYPEFAAFYQLLLSKLNEQVVIKKKDKL